MRYVAALVAALALAGGASAATVNYYGYAWLSYTQPPAGTCSGWPAGTACAGWNYWDYSQIDVRTTTNVPFGFIYTTGWMHLRWVWGRGTFTVLWSALGSGTTHYNRPACDRPAQPSYVQCRAIIV